MGIERARGDAVVAAGAGGTTIVVAVVSSVVGVSVGMFPSVAPLLVYVAYMFSRKGGPYGSWDTARNWAAVAVAVGVVVLAAAAVRGV
jgi:hypothetical protein